MITEEREQKVYPIETHKAVIEYIRFFTTLSTGSLVLLTSFIKNLTSQPRVGFLVGWSLVGFTVSIISAVICYTVAVSNFGTSMDNKSSNIFVRSLFTTWVFFLLGIISLAIFGIANL